MPIVPDALGQILAIDDRFRHGNMILKHGSLVQIVAATTSYTLFQLSATRSLWLFGIQVYNDNDAEVRISIGTGDFTANMPQFGPVLADTYEMLWFPPRYFTADVVVQGSVGAASPSEVEVMAWVFEQR